MAVPAKPADEVVIDHDNTVRLPSERVRQLGWAEGDRLALQLVGDDLLILSRHPKTATELFAGRLGHVFGNHAEVMGYIENERRSWDTGEADERSLP